MERGWKGRFNICMYICACVFIYMQGGGEGEGSSGYWNLSRELPVVIPVQIPQLVT